MVRTFRQILLWPVQLMPVNERVPIRKHWEFLQRTEGHPWKEIDDEFTGDPRLFQERHYHEFVSFLPYVQRFLYGDELGRGRVGGYGESPMRVFRRRDVSKLRATFAGEAAPTVFDIAHIDLYFFYDLDIAILVLEIGAENLLLSRVQDTLFRLGRAYPAYWEKDGNAGNCARRIEWLSHGGDVLAVSDFQDREEYLAYACEHRAARIASHWEFLLRPLAESRDSMETKGYACASSMLTGCRPIMAYLAVDDPARLTHADFVRLAFAGPPGDSRELPYSTAYLRNFEQEYCYDREWGDCTPGAAVRFLCCGHAFVTVGPAASTYFTDGETGILGQFRHELFLLGLIAHFHKASLLMLSDRVTVAISRLDIESVESARVFRHSMRQTLETFLRFTHRY